MIFYLEVPKTLAKLANRVAKKSQTGVFDLTDCSNPDAILAKTEVGDIWGIGSKYGKWCREQGINNALQFRDTNEGFIRKKMDVIGVRMLMELRGISCLPMELVVNPKKETCISHSFSQPITELSELKEAIATYTHRAAEKLRKQRQAANVITVFARTSPFKDDFYSNSATLEMPVATNNTVELLRASSQLIECIYRQGESFKKGGVILTGLVDECVSQTNLFDRLTDEERERSLNLMTTMDNLNSKYGRDALKFASAGVKQIWKTKAEMRSPRYTTCWEELLW